MNNTALLVYIIGAALWGLSQLGFGAFDPDTQVFSFTVQEVVSAVMAAGLALAAIRNAWGWGRRK
jgi:hypothetical protein